jgi:CheY-like chemotaxis protein
MRILVIEDSRMLRLVIERSLVKAGHQVTVVGDGMEGLASAKATPPDVILLDMMLPTLEGTGVLRQLKSHPETRHVPVIVLSGLSQKNEEKLRKAGAAAYFEKSRLNLDDNAKSLVDIVQQIFTEA